eukprot:c20585_g4_i1.p1 GENE.c20585_g4_i1~~c20585_g4_i1.p1  ORF type:complete len:203 (+),score=8.78 c20585_g4_i1:140-748(+)
METSPTTMRFRRHVARPLSPGSPAKEKLRPLLPHQGPLARRLPLPWRRTTGLARPSSSCAECSATPQSLLRKPPTPFSRVPSHFSWSTCAAPAPAPAPADLGRADDSLPVARDGADVGPRVVGEKVDDDGFKWFAFESCDGTGQPDFYPADELSAEQRKAVAVYHSTQRAQRLLRPRGAAARPADLPDGSGNDVRDVLPGEI